MFNSLDLSLDAPWKQRFRAPFLFDVQIAAANPARGIIWTDQSGTMQIHAWDIPTNQFKQVTHKPTGVWYGAIASNGQYIYYFDDQNGNEFGHYVRIPFAGGEPEDLTPDLPPFLPKAISDNDTSTILSLELRYQTTYLLNQDSTGKLSQLRRFKHNGAFFIYFPAEIAFSVINSFTHSHTFTQRALTAIELASHEVVATLSIPDDNGCRSSLSILSCWEQSGHLKVLVKHVVQDTTRLFIWQVGRQAPSYLPFVVRQGELQVTSTWGDDLLLRHTHRARHQLYTFHLRTNLLTRLDLNSSCINTAQFINDEEILAKTSNITHPSRLVILSRNTGRITRTLSESVSLPASRPWTEVVFPSTYGVEIQAWLALPPGKPPFPTILDVHGGPRSATMKGFRPDCQVWLDHGFAWMSVNYRGSTGFGKDFENSLEWEHGKEAVEDMVAGRDWLIQQGIANPAAILVTGCSYGGFLTIQALSWAPDLWAGGMAHVAFAKTDWRTQQIRAPLLIIQGKYDSRCSPEAMREYERQLISLGKEVQIHWFDNGHFQNDVELTIRHQEVMLRFAYRVLNDSLSIFTGAANQNRSSSPGCYVALGK